MSDDRLGTMMFRFSVIVLLSILLVSPAENGMLNSGLADAAVIAILFGIGSVHVAQVSDVARYLWNKVGESNV